MPHRPHAVKRDPARFRRRTPAWVALVDLARAVHAVPSGATVIEIGGGANPLLAEHPRVTNGDVEYVVVDSSQCELAKAPPAVVRGAFAVLAVACGGGMAWGRWRGRAADAWAIDAVKFLLGSHRLNWIRGK